MILTDICNLRDSFLLSFLDFILFSQQVTFLSSNKLKMMSWEAAHFQSGILTHFRKRSGVASATNKNQHQL